MDSSPPLSVPRTVALVGLMGAGKSAIGKRLALRLGLPFVDADDEIERAAGCSIAEFFERFGEAEFRDIADMVADVLDGLAKNSLENNGSVEQQVNERVRELCARFPIYQG